MNNPDDPQHWVAKAESDLLNIRNNLRAERVPWDTICFHAQQAAEKMLKAFLASRGQAAGRTHDLENRGQPPYLEARNRWLSPVLKGI